MAAGRGGLQPGWSAQAAQAGLPDAFAQVLDEAIGGSDHLGRVLNVRPDPRDFRDFIYKPALIELPAFLAPPVAPGTDPATAPLLVRNQYTEGSCTGQALAAVIDIQNIKRRELAGDAPWRVSARMLYASAQLFDEFADDELPGSSLRGALKGFWNRGACQEKLMPYLSGLANDRLTPEIAKDARRTVLGSYMRVSPVLNDYHAAIKEAGAILVSAMIHDGWRFDKVAAAKGVITMKSNPRPVGAHAFAIVGYTGQGFLVLNSWGARWGNYDLRSALCKDAAGRRMALSDDILNRENVLPGPYAGIALWSYEDWQKHVLDAWVLRLAAPVKRVSGEIGGYVGKPDIKTVQATARRSVRESDVIGHLLHLSSGALVKRGLYASDLQSLKDTAQLLRDDIDKKYDHILLHFHGAFDQRDNSLARARAMIPVFKRNRIYPVFVLWRTVFTEILPILTDAAERLIRDKSGDQIGPLQDKLIEKTLRPVFKLFWQGISAEAQSAFSPSGEGFLALRDFLAETRRKRGPSPGIHMWGQSAGALAMGAYVESMATDKPRQMFSTTTLHAPACSMTFLAEKFEANRTLLGNMQIHNLTKGRERAADPSLPHYGKSPLWLMSSSFGPGEDAAIAGIEEFWTQDIDGFTRRLSPAGRNGGLGTCRSHGGFDRDPVIMNDLLTRITGKKISDRQGGFKLTDIAEAGFT